MSDEGRGDFYRSALDLALSRMHEAVRGLPRVRVDFDAGPGRPRVIMVRRGADGKLQRATGTNADD